MQRGLGMRLSEEPRAVRGRDGLRLLCAIEAMRDIWQETGMSCVLIADRTVRPRKPAVRCRALFKSKAPVLWHDEGRTLTNDAEYLRQSGVLHGLQSAG